MNFLSHSLQPNRFSPANQNAQHFLNNEVDVAINNSTITYAKLQTCTLQV